MMVERRIQHVRLANFEAFLQYCRYHKLNTNLCNILFISFYIQQAPPVWLFRQYNVITKLAEYQILVMLLLPPSELMKAKIFSGSKFQSYICLCHAYQPA